MIAPLSLLLLVCGPAAPAGAGPKEAEMIRQPAVADQFYPGDAKTLAAMIDSMLASAEGPAVEGLVGIQVPHAGYPYSGPTAAHAFKLLKGRDGVTVVMFGTSHRAFIDKAALYAKGSWHTPLGDVAIDEDLAKALLAADSFVADNPKAHAGEHSLEVQVPLLQRVLGDFKMVPLMLLRPSLEECERLGRAVASVAKGKDVVLLASTDLYHGESYDEAKRTDTRTAGFLTAFDPKGLYEALSREEAQACGGYGVVAMMTAARELGADKATLLAQTNSNDVMHERGGYCVGYSAVAFSGAGAAKKVAAADSNELSEAEQRTLLKIARSTLESYVPKRKLPNLPKVTGKLDEKRGVFVTLHRKGELRGCIGYVEPMKRLAQAVQDMAVASSTEDPRFPPVTADELGDIDIEITVMSLLSPLADPDSVVVGKHGLVIRKGGRSGLLLPQVPVEQGWDRTEYLEYVCLKAGLPRISYKQPDAQLFTFTGQVFGEKTLGVQR